LGIRLSPSARRLSAFQLFFSAFLFRLAQSIQTQYCFLMHASPFAQRKTLPHQVPAWVGQGARHFVTINARDRAAAPFAAPAVAGVLLENLRAYETLGKWHIWIAVIMPDHLHFIATFNLDDAIHKTVAAWKRYQTRTLTLQFQRDYFEHRLRNEDEFVEKMNYIRENPVRKQLVKSSADYPYIIG